MNDLYPDVGQRGPGNDWEMRQHWEYQWTAEGRRWRLWLRDGYPFEPSVPRIAWPFVSPLEALTASAGHDFLYYYQGRIPPDSEDGGVDTWDEGEWNPYTEQITRYDADRFFGRILREQEVTRWRRRAAFLAVHFFGGRVWQDTTN